ncbi:uncharacterized protein [Rutidosis leptorrhynchoides]|uniref:uncharacterized protein n=1 Tax=Rutidosis leptorrhynchoides TaxID=125765 RepID=UPI003A98D3D0
MLKDEIKDFCPKPFKIFDLWMDDPECLKIVSEAWAEQPNIGTRRDCWLLNKLKNVKGALKAWSKKKFGKIDDEIEELKIAALNLELKAETSPLSDSELQSWKENRKAWMTKENMKKRMLKQKSRIRWAIDGDENTKFIHAIIRNNYNKCNIRGLTINGCWNENPLDIKEEAVRHFSSLFEEKDGFRPSLSDLSYPSISHHDAESLEVKFTEQKS